MKIIYCFLMFLFAFILYSNPMHIVCIGNPSFTEEKLNDFIKKQTVTSDSLGNYHYFVMGDVFHSSISDSMKSDYISKMQNTNVTPTDYRFTEQHNNIMGANIFSDSLLFHKSKIIQSDSLRIGIFSILSPDYAVKNEYTNVQIISELRPIIEEQVAVLSTKVDQIILFSGMTKFVSKELVKDLDIDKVYGFDYSKSSNTTFKNDIKYYYLKGRRTITISY